MRIADLIVVGGGLAGSEAAWQAAQKGLQVDLYEMRPRVETGAHTGAWLAELVCSNSLGSSLPDRASGLLKDELRHMGSFLMQCADESAVPAGNALAVDRDRFARMVSTELEAHPNICIIREEMRHIPAQLVVIASGPLTSNALSQDIAKTTGSQHLYFYDAIAPIVTRESINDQIAYRASRYAKENLGTGDYLNCPFNKEEYDRFAEALVTAERISLKHFEKQLEEGVTAGAHTYFEGCLPVEVLASRDRRALAYGPMRPIGLIDPRVEKRAYAVVQLRQDNQAATLYNLVGFQTNLTFAEQKRVFRLIPGLENAEFVRYGQMHRNTFIYSPAHLLPSLQFRGRPDLFFAGQITGVEGYVGNIATGLLAGINAARYAQGETPLMLPAETMTGALCNYITQAGEADFQPMKANFGILPPLEGEAASLRGKRPRAAAFVERSGKALSTYWSEIGTEPHRKMINAHSQNISI